MDLPTVICPSPECSHSINHHRPENGCRVWGCGCQNTPNLIAIAHAEAQS